MIMNTQLPPNTKLPGSAQNDRDNELLKPNNPDGIEPHPNRKGFLDYLR
jgi:hypothetical protein